MIKIGRNDPCPCGSGKKYKKCCLDMIKKTIRPIETYHNPTIGFIAPRFKESDILNPLIRSSNNFKSFYETEMQSFNHEVIWLKFHHSMINSLGYTPGVKSKFTVFKDGSKREYIITLYDIPVPTKDAMIVAHELSHLLLIEKGYPGVMPTFSEALSKQDREDSITLSSRMNTVVQDILIDTHLKKYGFDLCSIYKERMNNEINSFSQMKDEYIPNVLRLWRIFDYALIILHYREVENNEELIDRFNNIYQSKMPDIYKDGQNIIQIMDKYGIDTPDSTFNVYREIINYLGLKDWFNIMYFNSQCI